MKKNSIVVLCILALVLPVLVKGQTKKIKDEIRRASKYQDQQKKWDTYHVYEKYLTNEQRYELNMFYWYSSLNVPKETSSNYWLLNSAKDGHIGAQLNLAYSYKIGRIVKKDSSLCRKWLLIAMGAKSNAACYYYGLNCLDNTFPPKVADSAIFYLLKARQENSSLANYALSFCYKYGLKTTKNDSLATFYYSEYKNSFTLKDIEMDLDYLNKSIFCPDGFCNQSLIRMQIDKFLMQLNENQDFVLEIRAKGEGLRGQQPSWEKAFNIRRAFIDNGISPERIKFQFGTDGHPASVSLIVGEKDKYFHFDVPSPPCPRIRKNLIL